MEQREIISALNECLQQQDNLNCIVNQKWKTANYAWRTAIWIEAAELVDKLNYKWWKDTTTPIDRRQLLLELVDVFHFMLSESILSNRSADNLYHSYKWATSHTRVTNKSSEIQYVEEFVMLTLENRPIEASFFQVMIALDIKIEELLKYYLGKNALNKFRQDNGYKDGTYRKQWNLEGQLVEDNVALEKIVEGSAYLSFATIFNELTALYEKV